MDIGVYQGEDPDVLNNIEIGKFTIEGLRDAPSGNPIVTTFSIDVDGILHVTSREKETGLEYSITIDNAMTRFENDKLDEARARVRSLFGEGEEIVVPVSGSDTENRRHRVEALALMEKAERLLGTVGAEDGEDLWWMAWKRSRMPWARTTRHCNAPWPAWPTCSIIWNPDRGTLPDLPRTLGRYAAMPALRLRLHPRRARRKPGAQPCLSSYPGSVRWRP